MELIQQACAQLAGHEDSFVREVAEEIAVLDRTRDDEMIVSAARLSTAKAHIKTLQAEVRRKSEQLKKLERMLFGQSSEKADKEPDDEDSPAPEEQSDASGGSGTALTCAQPAKKPRGLRGRQKVSIPAHLRREIVVHEPKVEQFCACGCATARMSEQVIEKLAYKPAEVYVVEERYPKYACRKCGHFVQAKVPERVFDYSRYDDSMSLAAVISKFADFLPHYRLQQIFGRNGVQINRSTLWRLVKRAGEALKPLYEALLADLQACTKLFMDETTARLLDPGRGKTKTCYMWAMCRDDRRSKGRQPPAVVFRFAPSRAGLHAEALLENSTGILQVDGYRGYNRLMALDRDRGPMVLAYCWAHVRRKFHHAWEVRGPRWADAKKVVQTIDRLFEIERELKGQAPAVRLAERMRLSEPIVDRLFLEMGAIQGQILMKDAFGDAINYTLKLRDGLRIFLSDGRVEMDNNLVENVIRPLALIRKNSLFAGSTLGGEIWAMLSSLIGTCKLNGVEPYAYLTWVFEKIAAKLPLAEYHKLFPWHCPIGRYPNDLDESEAS